MGVDSSPAIRPGRSPSEIPRSNSGERVSRRASSRAVIIGVASQIFAVPSELAEASRAPSALKPTYKTESVCPLRMRVSRAVVRSQTFTV
jgi:hypothetical protein